MGNIVISAVNKFYLEDSDIKRLLKYIAGKNMRKKEVRYCNGRGLPKDYQKAANCIICTQRYFGKAKKRRLYHYVISFSKDVEDANFVKIVAEMVADMFYEKHQVYYGVHEDTDNLHIHFAVNAVSYVNGKKWHQSKKEFEAMKKDIKKIIKEIDSFLI